MVLDGLDESGLRMTGAAYVKHHFDGRGNISHSVCIRKDQLKAPEAEGRVFKFSSGNLIGFFTLFNGLKDWSFSCLALSLSGILYQITKLKKKKRYIMKKIFSYL